MSSLFQKYNVPGPRYTSYPTVPYWETSPSVAQWVTEVARALDEARSGVVVERARSGAGATVERGGAAGVHGGAGAALYVHIPFCESLCTYCGCNTRITRNHRVSMPYVDVVLKEWGFYLALLKRKIALGEIHLGGGTPTFLTPDELERLMRGILDAPGVSLLKGAELSIEVDPRVTSQAHLEKLASLGFSRISLGVQDFDPRVQEMVHRIQSEEQVRQITDAARALGFQSVNYDLIYGLPLQTLESIRYTLEKVRALKPDRIAFYSYAHVPWIKPGQRRFTEADLPSGDAKRALYELGREMLEQAGYREIGMDHFALPSDSLWKAAQSGELHRNFMGYTTRQVAPLIGLGVSAIGDSWGAFAQNEKLLETYQDRVNAGELPIARGHLLDSEDLVLRRHILNLMTRFETSWKSASERVAYLEGIEERLEELARDGLVVIELQACRVTERGRPFLRNICMAFDARLMRKAPGTQLFSSTV